MWGFDLTSLGNSAAKAGGSFISDYFKAKNDRAWQKYRNAMVQISRSQNANAITLNENMAMERSAASAYNIKLSEYKTKAKAQVAAAAAGIEGGSVNQVMFQLDTNAARAQSNRKADLDAQLLGFQNAKMSNDFQAMQTMDYAKIPSPSPLLAMLGFASDLWNTDEDTKQL